MGIYERGQTIFDKTIYDSPVTALSLAVGFGVNQAFSKWAPGLSPSAGYEGSLKVAQFVGAAFLLKSALSPFLARVIREEVRHAEKYQRIHHLAVRYLVPLAISTVVLRSYGFPVKPIPGALFTMSIFYGMHLLNRAYRKSYDMYDERKGYAWYSKMPKWLQL
ncbi:MAG: hypothetical protein JSS10_07695 [Verrucomicrobia bacterium]|nr:hypothetical protein [Verrucomicrobiota bacterium]